MVEAYEKIVFDIACKSGFVAERVGQKIFFLGRCVSFIAERLAPCQGSIHYDNNFNRRGAETQRALEFFCM